NAGGLRLIGDKDAIDSIINYDGCIRLQQAQVIVVSNDLNKLEDLTEQILNMQVIMSNQNKKADWLLIHDKKTLGYYYNAIVDFKYISSYYLGLLNNSKETGKRLLSFLQNKYHFK